MALGKKEPQIPHPFEQNTVKGHLKCFLSKGYADPHSNNGR
jgi:hypothetical protein